VAFRRPLEKQQNWLSVLRRNAEAPIFVDEKPLTRSTTWKELKAKAQGRPLKQMLDVVNRFWNAWPYRLDKEVWGQEDFWASPAEFLARSGDCEDYCIAKYFTLRELGVPADDMRIVIVRESIRGIAHAVLAVYEGPQVHILDNLSEYVRPMQRVRNYHPVLSVNEHGRWMHVKAKPLENGHGTEK
jgi:predicted transglutaminase-like cysteine proteinase